MWSCLSTMFINVDKSAHRAGAVSVNNVTRSTAVILLRFIPRLFWGEKKHQRSHPMFMELTRPWNIMFFCCVSFLCETGRQCMGSNISIVHLLLPVSTALFVLALCFFFNIFSLSISWCDNDNGVLQSAWCLYVYFSKAYPWDRRYSARIKTSNVYNTWAPVNPIVQGTSCAG